MDNTIPMMHIHYSSNYNRSSPQLSNKHCYTKSRTLCKYRNRRIGNLLVAALVGSLDSNCLSRMDMGIHGKSETLKA